MLLAFHRSLSTVYSFDEAPLPVNGRHPTLRAGGVEVVLGPTQHQFERDLGSLEAESEYRKSLKARFSEMQSNRVPVVFSLMHLSALSGVRWAKLRSLVNREHIDSDYRVYPKQKSSGGLRWICVPSIEVRAVQKWIAENILISPGAINQLSNASQAYSSGCSIVRNAKQHSGAPWIVKIDIHSFFESVSERQVYWVFRRLGYPSLLCLEMARICTRITPPSATHSRKRDVQWRWIRRNSSTFNFAPYEAEQIGHLPQGSPTSPMLSNLVAAQFDKKIIKVTSEFDGVYTRYADDIVISFSQGSRASCQVVMERTRKILGEQGFVVNREKTHILGPGARKVVTGLVVNDEAPRLRRQTKSHIEVALHYIETNGLIAQADFAHSKHPIAYLNHLSGLIEFARSVEPTFGEKALKRLESIYARNTEMISTLAEFAGKRDFSVNRHNNSR